VTPIGDHARGRGAAVDLAARGDVDDHDDDLVFVDLVDDPIPAHSDPPHRRVEGREFGRSWRPGILP